MKGIERVELPQRDHFFNDGVSVKAIHVPKLGTMIEQHVHAYAHTTYFAAGAFRLWKDGVHVGDFKAPTGVDVPAGVKHMLQALEPNSIALCIHYVGRTGAIETKPSDSVLLTAIGEG